MGSIPNSSFVISKTARVFPSVCSMGVPLKPMKDAGSSQR